jgi:hypothetical protein
MGRWILMSQDVANVIYLRFAGGKLNDVGWQFLPFEYTNNIANLHVFPTSL